MAKRPKKSAPTAETAKDESAAVKPKRAVKAKPASKKPPKKPGKITKKITEAAAKRLPDPKTLGNKSKPAPDKPAPVPRKKRERKAHATRPTPEEEVKINERRFLVWDLYKAGASYRAISEHLKAKGEKHHSVGTVHSDLQFCLNLQHNELELDVKDHIENEVAVLRDVRLNFFPVMKDPKMPYDIRLNAGTMVINTVKEIARLRNLYKPLKMMLSPDDELAKILGISPDQLPDVDNTEDK